MTGATSGDPASVDAASSAARRADAALSEAHRDGVSSARDMPRWGWATLRPRAREEMMGEAAWSGAGSGRIQVGGRGGERHAGRVRFDEGRKGGGTAMRGEGERSAIPAPANPIPSASPWTSKLTATT